MRIYIAFSIIAFLLLIFIQFLLTEAAVGTNESNNSTEECCENIGSFYTSL